MKFFRKEKSWLWISSLLIVVVTSLPYILGFLNQGSDWEFSGFLIAVEDGNSYIAKMRQGAQGDWLFRSPYSTLEQAGALIYLPYLILGKILDPWASHFSYVLIFHAFRLISNFILCIATYEFISLFIKQVRLKQVSWLIALLGGGLGWMLIILGQPNWLGSIPLEFYSPESFGFLSLFTFPHLSLGRALMLIGLSRYLNPPQKGNSSMKTAALWLSLALIHILSAAIALFIIFVHWVVKNYSIVLRRKRGLSWASIEPILWPIIGAGIPLIVNLFLLIQDPYLQSWLLQNQITSPHPLHYLVAYGIFIPFSWRGLRNLANIDIEKAQFLQTWLIVFVALVMLPFGLQRRFAEGIWVVIVLLAALSFIQKERVNYRKLVILFAASIPSTLLLLVGSFQLAINPQSPSFVTNNTVTLFRELENELNPNEVVLGTYEIGNALPAWAPVTVVLGHGPESVGFSDLERGVYSVLNVSGSLKKRDQQFLSEQNVDYILSQHVILSGDLFSLTEIKSSSSYFLYRINH